MVSKLVSETGKIAGDFCEKVWSAHSSMIITGQNHAKENTDVDELQKIYDRWSEETEVGLDVKEAGCDILEQLYRHCGNEAREGLSAAVIEYGRKIEQRAFFAGYKQAFGLWMDILTSE